MVEKLEFGKVKELFKKLKLTPETQNDFIVSLKNKIKKHWKKDFEIDFENYPYFNEILDFYVLIKTTKCKENNNLIKIKIITYMLVTKYINKNMFRFFQLTPNLHNNKQKILFEALVSFYTIRYDRILIPGIMYYSRDFFYLLDFVKNKINNIPKYKYYGILYFIKEYELDKYVNWVGDCHYEGQLIVW